MLRRLELRARLTHGGRRPLCGAAAPASESARRLDGLGRRGGHCLRQEAAGALQSDPVKSSRAEWSGVHLGSRFLRGRCETRSDETIDSIYLRPAGQSKQAGSLVSERPASRVARRALAALSGSALIKINLALPSAKRESAHLEPLEPQPLRSARPL